MPPFVSRFPAFRSRPGVVTADLLVGTNLPTLLRAPCETQKPSPRRRRGIQRCEYLAGIAAAQSGDREIFKASPTSIASAETLVAWTVGQPLTAPANAAVATTLAGELKSIDALKGFGFSLEGDLQQAKGNTTAAKTA